MLSLLIAVVGTAVIVVYRCMYTAKMHRIGASVIGEAYRAREAYPDSYAEYHARAVASLACHGCDDLIKELPGVAVEGNQP